MAKNKINSTEKKTDVRLKNLKAPWPKGKSANPSGRPLGQRNYATIYREALMQLAKDKGITPNALEDLIEKVGIAKAIGGDFRFFQDIRDRIHGKPTQRTELTGAEGKALIPDKDSIQSADDIINTYLNGGNKKNT